MNTNNETPDERKNEWTGSSFIGLTVSMCTHTTNRSSNNIFVIFVLFLNVVWVTRGEKVWFHHALRLLLPVLK